MTTWMRLTGEDPVQRVRIRDKASGFADMRNGFWRLIVIDANYERDFFRIADRVLSDGDVFVDVGANHGLLSLGLAGKFGNRIQYHLFEPNVELLDSISRGLRLYPGVKMQVNQCAVSDHDGSVQMGFDKEHSGASQVVDAGGADIPSVKLDSYAANRQIGRIRFVKIDIEGHELAALKGAELLLKAGAIGAIYFEFARPLLSSHHDPMELIDYLDSVGYEVYYCRNEDLSEHPSEVFDFQTSQEGRTIQVSPVRGTVLPEWTDLFAVPRRTDHG